MSNYKFKIHNINKLLNNILHAVSSYKTLFILYTDK